MGILERLKGRGAERHGARLPRQAGSPESDVAALDRYQYLLRTLPPDAVEQAHTDAFADLAPGKRQQVLAALNRHFGEGGRTGSADPRVLGRMATHAEMREPGTMVGLLPGGLLARVAGSFVMAADGSAILQDLYADGVQLGGRPTGREVEETGSENGPGDPEDELGLE